MMSDLLLPATLTAYGVGILLASLVTVQRLPWARRAASVVFVATWVLHSATITQIAIQRDRFPLSNVSEFLLALGWSVLSMHLYLWFRVRAHSAALVLLPIAALVRLEQSWNA